MYTVHCSSNNFRGNFATIETKASVNILRVDPLIERFHCILGNTYMYMYFMRYTVVVIHSSGVDNNNRRGNFATIVTYTLKQVSIFERWPPQ